MKSGGGIAEHDWHSCNLEEAMESSDHSLLAVSLINLNLQVVIVCFKRLKHVYLPERIDTLVHTVELLGVSDS